MQMIDVLKRLAELDSKNPRVIKESDELGMMSQPKIPASINITATDGGEVGDMLVAIMKLAGVHQVEPEHLNPADSPIPLTAEPTSTDDHLDSNDDMRRVIDMLNPEKETEECWDNTPRNPTELNAYPGNSVGTPGAQDAAGSPGVDPRGAVQQPKAFATFESLMSEYRAYVMEENDHERQWRDVVKWAQGITAKCKNGHDNGAYRTVEYSPTAKQDQDQVRCSVCGDVIAARPYKMNYGNTERSDEGMDENSELMNKIESALHWFKVQHGEDADDYAAYLSVAKKLEQLGYDPESEEFKNAWKSVVDFDYNDYSMRQGEMGRE